MLIRSTIKPELMKQTILRGTLIGGAGALLILLVGTLVPTYQLRIWGLPAFLVGCALIVFGLAPYRKLARLGTHPHRLELDEKTLLFSQAGKPLFRIPLSTLDHASHMESATLYGIALYLKHPTPEKIAVLDPHLNLAAFIADSASRCTGCDLFLPFFSQRAFNQLHPHIPPAQHHSPSDC